MHPPSLTAVINCNAKFPEIRSGFIHHPAAVGAIPPPIPRLHFGTAGNLAAILRDIQFNYIVGGIFLIMTSTGGCDTAFDPAPNHLAGVRVYSGPRERVLGF